MQLGIRCFYGKDGFPCQICVIVMEEYRLSLTKGRNETPKYVNVRDRKEINGTSAENREYYIRILHAPVNQVLFVAA